MMEVDGIRFDERGLVPAIVQDAATGEVLMLAYMNREALERTISSGLAHYYSRSRQRLWLKGETSGNVQHVKGIYYDCDGDTILLKVEQRGVACHTGERTCFFNVLLERGPVPGPSILTDLYRVILARKRAMPEGSYVASLLKDGERILAKVEEEAGELIDAAKGKGDLIHELTDLLFHAMVLLAWKDRDIAEVFKELVRRFGISGIEEKKRRSGG